MDANEKYAAQSELALENPEGGQYLSNGICYCSFLPVLILNNPHLAMYLCLFICHYLLSWKNSIVNISFELVENMCPRF